MTGPHQVQLHVVQVVALAQVVVVRCNKKPRPVPSNEGLDVPVVYVGVHGLRGGGRSPSDPCPVVMSCTSNIRNITSPPGPMSFRAPWATRARESGLFPPVHKRTHASQPLNQLAEVTHLPALTTCIAVKPFGRLSDCTFFGRSSEAAIGEPFRPPLTALRNCSHGAVRIGGAHCPRKCPVSVLPLRPGQEKRRRGGDKKTAAQRRAELTRAQESRVS